MSTSQPLLSPITPGQVWRQLAAERRQRAIRCLAQLALHAVTARAEPAAQEVSHERPRPNAQIARLASPAPGVDLHPPVDPAAGAR